MKKECLKLINESEKECFDEFQKIEKICFDKTKKILEAFHKYEVCENDFHETTGYGYNDMGREKIERIFSEVLGFPDAIVRNQFVSASHALSVVFFALLRPGDILLSITGTPYDTMHEVIGIKENNSSLSSFGIKYMEIDLAHDDFDYEKIKEVITKNKIKVIEIQRSKGYSTRKSINIEKIKKVSKWIKSIDKEIIIMIDNCYCELVSQEEIGSADVDIAVGSLIKNLGGGIAPNGAYVVGRHDLIELVGERLTLPGEGREVGPTLGVNKQILQGLFLAPSVVASSLKVAILTSHVLEKLGYVVEPKYNEERVDVVQSIVLHDENKLIQYVQGIQKASPIDSNSIPIPWNMPGYDDPVIMASGSFIQGSSIEISCDAPIRSPYIAYQQGALTYESGKLALASAIEKLIVEL
ncbi:MAG: hypothetical protein HFJ12_03210 [Bacilli bacterium]|nr:hypothetical protein [Bacilli bacterium]